MTPEQWDREAERQAAATNRGELRYAQSRPSLFAFISGSLIFGASAVLVIYGLYGIAVMLGL